MVFSSALFLCLFLPLVCLFNRLMPNLHSKNRLLMVASLIFYAFGNVGYVLLLLVSVMGNYLAGLHVTKETRSGKVTLFLAVAFNLGLLCVFKYGGFLIENLNWLLTHIGLENGWPVPAIPLPVGISFFTFQGLSYVIDVYYDERLRNRHFGDVLLYIALFPQLVAGPIVKYRDIAAEIRERTVTPADTAQGIRRFIIGLTKKLLLADVVGEMASLVYALDESQFDIRLAWLGTISYTLQIYFDFSGYSDMAIGLGRLFGFHFKENFQYPYAAHSIKDFWRRWHISLSSWFRDYLYIPLGGNRNGAKRTYRNKLVVFFCTGLWHGANWTFILWGLWHGFFLIVEDIVRNTARKRTQVLVHQSQALHEQSGTKTHRPPVIMRIVEHGYTLLVVMLGFMLFRADSLQQAGLLLTNLFTGFARTVASTAALAQILDPLRLTTLIVGCILCTPLLPWLRKKSGGRGESVTYPTVLVLFVLDLLHLSAASYVPFIYFQF